MKNKQYSKFSIISAIIIFYVIMRIVFAWAATPEWKNAISLFLIIAIFLGIIGFKEVKGKKLKGLHMSLSIPGLAILLLVYIFLVPTANLHESPNQCSLQKGINCIDYAYEETTRGDVLLLSFRNDIGHDIKNFKVKAITTKDITLQGATVDEGVDCVIGHSNITLLSNQQITCAFDATSENSEYGEIKGHLTLIWTDIAGEIVTKRGNFYLKKYDTKNLLQRIFWGKA